MCGKQELVKSRVGVVPMDFPTDLLEVTVPELISLLATGKPVMVELSGVGLVCVSRSKTSAAFVK